MNVLPSGRDRAVDMPVIRAARAGDLDALVAIENAAFASDRLTRRSLARLLGVSTSIVLVAEQEGAPVGAAVVLVRSYSRRARLYSLAVAPGLSGRGIGSALLAAAEGAALDRDAKWLTLEVREDNAAARRLYETRGFALSGRSEDYYSDGAAALHFSKALARAAERAA